MSEFGINITMFLTTNNASDNIYWDCNSNVPSSLNNLQHEVLLLEYVISLMALFWSLNTLFLSGEFPQNITPYVMTEWK